MWHSASLSFGCLCPQKLFKLITGIKGKLEGKGTARSILELMGPSAPLIPAENINGSYGPIKFWGPKTYY